MKKISKIPTILGIVILVVGTFLGVFYLNMTQVFRIGASPEGSPKDVRVGNVTDTSATISWTTDGQSLDFLNWGTGQNSVNKVTTEDTTNSKYYTHSITLTGLSPNTNYYYRINSDGSSFDSGGIPWQFTTGAAIGTSQTSYPISGSVITASGQPEKRALVYLNAGGYFESTITSDTGNFILQLGNIRSQDLQSFAAINPASTLLEISVDAGPDGVSSAQIFPQSANPIPTIVLGQVYDLRSSPANSSGVNPSVNLQLPLTSTPESKFNVATISGSTKPTSVLLENINEGETVTSTQPQFFGKGPSGEKITITLHSATPITQTVQIAANNSWSWTPPASLDPGAHTITITWIDVTGITRTLTRDFVVQAGEVPAFTASQSASTPIPSPSALVEPTARPILPTPKISPTPIATQTAEPVPVTGDLTPTLILSIMGLSVMAFSFFMWKLSES